MSLKTRVSDLERKLGGEGEPTLVVHWRWLDEAGVEHVEPPLSEGCEVLNLRWPEEAEDERTSEKIG